MCGAKLKSAEKSVAVIVPAASVEPPVEVSGPLGSMKRLQEHRFDLCPACVLGLLVSLKDRKRQIKKYGAITSL
jgi:hypothetical protein